MKTTRKNINNWIVQDHFDDIFRQIKDVRERDLKKSLKWLKGKYTH